MNKQQKPGGGRGIEWCTHTWNPVSGCQHNCRWEMPDGTIAECYAETVAEGVAQHAYPHGFEHHYWSPERLNEPLKLKAPAKIFLDSMSDLMGHWVPDGEINAVFDVCREAHWHTFQLLTKNAPRLTQFRIPHNVWVGVSAPPSQMFGKPLSADQQTRMVKRQLEALHALSNPVRWMSIEPLSFDIAPLLQGAYLEWVVIGAASNGRKTYQPDSRWVTNLLRTLDLQGTRVFFKGNLDWTPWREEFPATRQIGQRKLFEMETT